MNPIEAYRKAAGKSQRAAAVEIRIVRRALRSAETGGPTKWATITAIAAWMNVKPEQLEQQLAKWQKETAQPLSAARRLAQVYSMRRNEQAHCSPNEEIMQVDTQTVGDERQATNVGISLTFPYGNAKNYYVKHYSYIY